MRIEGGVFLAHALTHLGKSYVWAAKGPNQFDCSGLVTFVLRECGGPDWRETHNTKRLFSILDPWHPELEWAFPREIPRGLAIDLRVPTGMLLFYGAPGSTSHVMIATGDGRAFGACGGDSSTVAPKPGACVQFRPSIGYRLGCRGFRQLPELSA